jgi:hypothetical protein
MTGHRRSHFFRTRSLVALLAIGAVAAPPAAAQKLPFYAGEELSYRLQVGGLGTVGSGTMTVSRGEARGTSALLLTSEFRSSTPIVGGDGLSRSWLDPVHMRVLRFQKRERTPFSRGEESYEIFPAERRWTSDAGERGTSPTSAPLDELAFIYFIRTLPLKAGDFYQFDRHFEAGRNPVSIRVLRRETIEVGIGSAASVVVEMRVRDPERYRGDGVITLYLSDDDCRVPLRIESRMPKVGRTVLSLEAHSHPAGHGVGR